MFAHRILRRVYGPSEIDDDLLELLARELSALSGIPGVIGVGLGIKCTNHSMLPAEGACLVVYVRQKRPQNALRRSRRIPRTVDGIPTDVIAIAPRNHTSPPATVAPRSSTVVQPGTGIELKGIGRATAGARVTDARGERFILTAAHALYGTKSFKRRVAVHAVPSGSLVGSTHDVHFGLDAGLIKLDAAAAFDQTTLISRVPLTAPRPGVIGETLEKSGATSGVTQAVVTSIGRVGTLFPALTLAPPVPDVDPEPLAREGDSGSIWYDPLTGAAVGLHVQGSAATKRRGEYGIATSLPDVLGAFAVGWG